MKSEKRDFYQQEVRAGKSITTIARENGVTHGAVWNALNYVRTARYTTDPEVEAELRELYAQGLSDSEIGQKAGFVRITIWEWRRKFGLPANKRQGGQQRIRRRE